MTVEELLGRIKSKELSEWIAYARTNPFGEERADIRSALIAWTVATAFGSGKKLKIEDFMLDFGKPKKVEPMNNEVMWNIIKGMARK